MADNVARDQFREVRRQVFDDISKLNYVIAKLTQLSEQDPGNFGFVGEMQHLHESMSNMLRGFDTSAVK